MTTNININTIATTENKHSIAYYILVLIGSILLIVGAFAAEAALVMLLWNAIMPMLFANVFTITFWQAAGLWVLCDLLFCHIPRRFSKNK